MRVKAMGRTWQGSTDEAKKLMETASGYVKCGIYAIEHKGQDCIELVNMPMSKTQIKQFKRRLKGQGVKVYANGL